MRLKNKLKRLSKFPKKLRSERKPEATNIINRSPPLVPTQKATPASGKTGVREKGLMKVALTIICLFVVCANPGKVPGLAP